MRKIKDAALKVLGGVSAAATLTAPVLAQTSSDGDAAAGIIVMMFYCCICIFLLLYLGLKIYLTMDALNRDYGDDTNQKILGIILIWVVDSFATFVGIILYYFLIMRKYPKVNE